MNETAQTIESKPTWIDYLKLTPLFYSSLVIIGFLKLYVFYSFFNIDIENYLDISEILVSFLDDIIPIIAMIIVVIPVSYMFSKIIKLKTKHQINVEKEDIILPLKTRKIFYTIVFFFYLRAVVYFIVHFIADDWIVYSISFSLNSIMQGSILLFIVHLKLKYRKYITLSMLIATTLVLVGTLIILSIIDVDRYKYEGEYYAKEVLIGNDTITSDVNQCIIGKTNNFVFLYNRNDSTTTAYQSKDIGYIKLKK